LSSLSFFFFFFYCPLRFRRALSFLSLFFSRKGAPGYDIFFQFFFPIIPSRIGASALFSLLSKGTGALSLVFLNPATSDSSALFARVSPPARRRSLFHLLPRAKLEPFFFFFFWRQATGFPFFSPPGLLLPLFPPAGRSFPFRHHRSPLLIFFFSPLTEELFFLHRCRNCLRVLAKARFFFLFFS